MWTMELFLRLLRIGRAREEGKKVKRKIFFISLYGSFIALGVLSILLGW
ncbi:hypothetical protein ES702_03095 [subsurface metagenome]